jgi:hypothetical protein
MSKTQEQNKPAQQKTDPHCRICGYKPRKSRAGKPDYSWDKIILHLETNHPADVLPTREEILILEKQGHAQ